MNGMLMSDLHNAELSDSIEEFFTKEELEKMCTYEQNRYKNIRKNYEMAKRVGLPAVKPEFMQRRKKHKRKEDVSDVTDCASEAESDLEWLPKHKKPSGRVWKCPVQSAVRCPAEKSAKMRKKKDKVSTCAEKDSDDKPRVYEFRKRMEINYMHVEVPADDEFLYCEECNLDYPGDCPVQGPLHAVSDVVVPADGADADRALHTLPAGLEVRDSGIPNAGLGVWATQFFPVRTRFGPYEGRRVTDPAVAYFSGYCWQIYSEGKESHFVDAKDCSMSNWMRYVNCARTACEQNLTAYQHRGKIFYRSHCDIQPDTELLVWYGADYGQELGITRDEACRSSGRLGPADGVFPCPHCRLAFSDSNYFERHTKRKHGHLRNVNKAQLAQRDKDRSTNNSGSRHLKEDPISIKTKRHKNSKTDDLCDRNQTCGQSLTDGDSLDVPMTTNAGDSPQGNQTSGKSFSKHRNLNAHKNTQTNKEWNKFQTCADSINVTLTRERPYKKCNTCAKTCTGNVHHNTHMRKRTRERPYTCNTCGKTFTQSGNLNQHMQTHTGERPYTCNACGKTFTQSGNLKRHTITHTGERPYTCNTCGKTFTQSGDLNKHIRTHTGERPHTCSACGKTFTENGDLNKHIRTHTGERPYTCSACGKTFTQSGNLNQHMQTHTGERPHTCNACGKTFTQSGDLKRHTRKHTGERPHTYNACGKTFTQSGDLKRHTRKHTGERPHTCNACGKAFTQSGDLKTHTRKHTGERPYTCSACGKTFTRSGHLNQHMRTHTGERPYTCSACGKTFTRSGDLKRHMRTHTS